ncbi:hybrid-cluster NAD(P)-dependent oxidoreductase [Vibrio mangrovi]|uniref:Hybrid-cluster NAD(P)-dependent oxidoreductase n=1 Tax=Vibrio mangrovi TaxID=474394 RepID=A0A1Y6IZ50_9VIBR|nr:hybrid-cluster NAD(P)-dependent oxidoreductase [Vibrio mangrovi]MDW6005290.1 hybrid-cluster NAD(P)-dependent oxidoreductase [Vibrio mangrovi]SMS02916.1 NADH oxidoreductase hcr [Vibrio mangrovi]
MIAEDFDTPVALVCTEKWHETPDTVSFVLACPENARRFQFKPGQFASLGFEINGKVEYRAYSISTLPDQTMMKFTVKRVEGGKVSNHVVDSLNSGDIVQLLKPQGAFNNVDCTHRGRVALISAGCGITPVMSMTADWLSRGDVDIVFIHIARDVLNTIYYEELLHLNAVHPSFHLKLLLKQAGDSSHTQGRLDQNYLLQLCPDILERTVYLCGPEGFMQDVTTYLEQIGFQMDDCYQEKFSAEAMGMETFSPVSDSSNSPVTVDVPGFGVSVEAQKGELLLDALESAGVPVIAACRSGICGSCKCRVEQGQIEFSSQETLSEEEIRSGYVLSCSSRIRSDLKVSL